jgi:WD40 repeat protein
MMVRGPGTWWDLGSVNELTAVKWSPDDKELLLGTYKGVVLRFDPFKGEMLQESQVFDSSSVVEVAYIAYGEKFRDQYAASSGSKICSWTSKPGPGSYSISSRALVDYSVSHDGKFRIIVPDERFHLNDFGTSVRKVPRIEVFGQVSSETSTKVLEFVADCAVSEVEEKKFHNRYVGKTFIPVLRWDTQWVSADNIGGPGAQDSDEIYCDRSGKLLRDTFRLVFTSDRWWRSDPANLSVIVEPKGDLFVSQLQYVDWSSRAVPVRTLESVERPKNYDWQHNSYSGLSSRYSELTWSPDDQFIAGVIDGHVIGLWRTSDGSFVRPIGCNSVIYSEVNLPEHDPRRDFLQWSPDGRHTHMFWGKRAVRWSPDGRYLASATRRRLLVWEVASGRLVEEFVNKSAQPYSNKSSAEALNQDGAFEWSHDGKRLVFVSLFGDVEVYDF